MGQWVNHGHVKGTRWQLWKNDDNRYSDAQVLHALLMDIRDELERLNALLHCGNFTSIPATLREIRVNTMKRKRTPRNGAKA